MVLSTETFNQSVHTEYTEAVNVCYTFQPLWVSGNASNDGDIATLFKDLEDKGSFYGFPVRRRDTSDSNFDSDDFTSGEEDGGNQGVNDDTDAEEARWK